MMQLMKREQVAERLNIKPAEVDRLGLPFYRLSKQTLRWAKLDVDAYAKSTRKITLLSAAEIASRAVPTFNRCGVYFLILRGEIVYIGQSINVASRIGKHATVYEFDSYAFIECRREDLADTELAYIYELSPRYNLAGWKKSDEGAPEPA